MENMGSLEGCPDESSCFDRVTEAYRSFQTESCPGQSAVDTAHAILLGVRGPRAVERQEYNHGNTVNLTCISLSLLEKITSRLTSQNERLGVRGYFENVLSVMFENMDLMPQLVNRFQSEDQIISHLAAKSASSYVFHGLVKSGEISPAWLQACVQAFQCSPPSTELDACLWSLIAILKILLKQALQELLEKLLVAFDSSICALCLRFLPLERKKETPHSNDQTSSKHWGISLCLLLDLLEVLTASTSIGGSGVCLESQRLSHIHASSLLDTVSCSSQYFVKKRILLLLKRTVLHKAGEDWFSAKELSFGLKPTPFNCETRLLVQSVLHEVSAGWLQSIQTQSTSFFGGTADVKSREYWKPDCVMLRAVSLLLLKSVDLHIQATAGAGNDVTEVHDHLKLLWGFVRRSGLDVTHCCCLFTLLFAEQDDDMMEAAKALLSIFLHHRVSSWRDDSAVLKAACTYGCNPHCHFLLLLQSISFDHSILLDFLISTETCFLEYFVLYLKYLRGDWQGFAAVCQRNSTSSQQTQTPFDEGVIVSAPWEMGAMSGSMESSTYDLPPAAERVSLFPGLRLVDYGSSDESDPDNIEYSEDSGTSACKKSQLSDWNVKDKQSRPLLSVTQPKLDSSDSIASMDELQSLLGGRPGKSRIEQTSPNMEPLSGQSSCETLGRAVSCLSKLSEVVMRLQTKNLFPYNPSSLLKLLTQVNKCSQPIELVMGQ